jgi:hypothetical protein
VLSLASRKRIVQTVIPRPGTVAPTTAQMASRAAAVVGVIGRLHSLGLILLVGIDAGSVAGTI